MTYGYDAETVFQQRVLRYLSQHARTDVFAIAIPNQAKRGFKTAAKMKAEGMYAGAADLCILLPAQRCAWLELKTERGTQSDSQKGFEARCKRLGHPYGVAHNLEQAIAFMTKVGALRP